MSRRGNCWDNAPAESFFATLKMELAFRTEASPRATRLATTSSSTSRSSTIESAGIPPSLARALSATRPGSKHDRRAQAAYGNCRVCGKRKPRVFPQPLGKRCAFSTVPTGPAATVTDLFNRPSNRGNPNSNSRIEWLELATERAVRRVDLRFGSGARLSADVARVSLRIGHAIEQVDVFKGPLRPDPAKP